MVMKSSARSCVDHVTKTDRKGNSTVFWQFHNAIAIDDRADFDHYKEKTLALKLDSYKLFLAVIVNLV